MAIATMVVLWDALVRVGTVVAILALLLLGLLTIAYSLVALYWLYQARQVIW